MLSKIKASFDLIYEDYPRKEGRKEAERHYRASVKTIEDVAKISSALDCYIKQVKDTERRFIKQASAWFNNWRDYITDDWQELAAELKQDWETEYEDCKREEGKPGADD